MVKCMMSFLYDDYKYMLFIVPVLTGIMEIIFTIEWCVCCFFVKDKSKRMFKLVFGLLCFLLLFFCGSYEKLSNGGIYLATEKEADAIIKESVIENIFDPSDRLHGFASSYGADIEVDGRLFFIESVDNLSVGDKVLFKYLPKSTCVLEITKIE